MIDGYAERLRRVTQARGAFCVGLDPHPSLLTAWGLSVDAAGAETLTRRVVQTTPEGGPPAQRVATWEKRNAEGLNRARATLTEIGELESFDLARLSVALRAMRTLAQQA